MENKTLLSIKDLSIGHDGQVLCSGISFDVHEGDCIMLCGANGSGKTTLMKSLMELSEDRDPMHENMIMIPARIPKVSGFTLREFVRISCFRQCDMSGRLSSEIEVSLESALADLGLKHLADRDISTLSDGEFQKAGIASALVRNASIILLDEPTAFLDAENRIGILNTLKAICSRDIPTRPAVIFSTHDLHDGLKVCTKVMAFGADNRFHISPDSVPSSLSATVSRIFSTPL